MNENTARMIKSQYSNRYRLSTDIFVDAEATKHMFQLLYKTSNYSGYIQYIAQNPFGILLMSEIQVYAVSGVNLYLFPSKKTNLERAVPS